MGGRLSTGKGKGILGIRIPVGLIWLPRGAPLDLFAEIVPVVDLIPATELNWNGGLGVRYFFR